MSIRRLQSGQADEAGFLAVGGQIDDGADSWWAGAQRCFAGIALATALAASVFAADLASGVQQDPEELPAGSLKNFSTPDEDYWQNPQITQITQTPPSFYQRLPYLPDPEEIPAGTLWAVPEEFYWQNPVAPVAAAIFQRLPYLPDPEELPAGSLLKFTSPDEDYWQNPQITQITRIPPSLYQPLPVAAGESAEVIPPVVFQPEEDFWKNPAAPVPLAFGPLYLPDPEEIPAGTLEGQPDEDYWQNPQITQITQTPPSFYQPLPYSYDAGEPGQFHWITLSWLTPDQTTSTLGYNIYRGTSPGGEDLSNPINGPTPLDIGAAPSTQLSYNDCNICWGVTYFYVVYSYDTSTDEESIASNEVQAQFPPPVDEDFWQNPQITQITQIWPSNYQELPYLPDPTDDPAGKLAVFSTPDEDFWENPVAPVPLAFGPLYLPDPEEIPAGTLRGQPDEDFWQNPVAPVSAAIFQRLPYLPDPEEVPAGSLIKFTNPDEDHWQNPQITQITQTPPSLYQRLPVASGETAEILPQVVLPPDEDFWANPVAPIPLMVYQRLPYLPELSDDPASSLAKFTSPDEDYWQNPQITQITRILPSFYQPLPVASGETAEILPQVVLPPDEDCWQNPIIPAPAAQGWVQPVICGFGDFSSYWRSLTWGVCTHSAARGRVSHSAARERISRSAVRPRTTRGISRQSTWL